MKYWAGLSLGEWNQSRPLERFNLGLRTSPHAHQVRRAGRPPSDPIRARETEGWLPPADAGRDFRLTGVHGEVVDHLIA